MRPNNGGRVMFLTLMGTFNKNYIIDIRLISMVISKDRGWREAQMIKGE